MKANNNRGPVDYPVHPAAELFPMMSEDEFQGLKADIAEHGQRKTITIWNGLLVDGRNRMRACNELEIEPRVQELAPSADPVSWAVSENLHRRHLSTGQRSIIAAKLETFRHGDNQHSEEMQNCISRKNAAKLLNVSPRSVATAKQVIENCPVEVSKAVAIGSISLNAAAKMLRPASSSEVPIETLAPIANPVDLVRQLLADPSLSRDSQIRLAASLDRKLKRELDVVLGIAKRDREYLQSLERGRRAAEKEKKASLE